MMGIPRVIRIVLALVHLHLISIRVASCLPSLWTVELDQSDCLSKQTIVLLWMDACAFNGIITCVVWYRYFILFLGYHTRLVVYGMTVISFDSSIPFYCGIYDTLRNPYYWPHMAKDVYKKATQLASCAQYRDQYKNDRLLQFLSAKGNL